MHEIIAGVMPSYYLIRVLRFEASKKKFGHPESHGCCCPPKANYAPNTLLLLRIIPPPVELTLLHLALSLFAVTSIVAQSCSFACIPLSICRSFRAVVTFSTLVQSFVVLTLPSNIFLRFNSSLSSHRAQAPICPRAEDTFITNSADSSTSALLVLPEVACYAPSSNTLNFYIDRPLCFGLGRKFHNASDHGCHGHCRPNRFGLRRYTRRMGTRINLSGHDGSFRQAGQLQRTGLRFDEILWRHMVRPH